MPISDEGSGAWLGCEAVRRLLWALDGRIASTGLLRALGEKFGNDPSRHRHLGACGLAG